MSRQMRMVYGCVSAFALCVLWGCGDGASKPAAPPRSNVIKVGTVLSASHPTAASLSHFKASFERLSGGAMTVEIQYDGVLGDPLEMLECCRDGTIGIAHVSAVDLTHFVRVANALAMPFIWRDVDQQRRLLDGEVGRVIRESAAMRSFEILGYLDAGFRSLTTKKGGCAKPQELAGLYIRTMPAQVMTDTLVAFGAFPTPTAQDEVRDGLEAGWMDGWENNPITIATYRTYEVGCTHVTWTRHLSIPDVLVTGKPFLAQLSQQERQWFDQAVRETVAKQHEAWKAAEEKAVADLAAHGVKFHDVDVEPFRAKVRPLYERYYKRYGPEFRGLCEMILGQTPTTSPASTRASQ